MDSLLKKNLVFNLLGNLAKIICPFLAFSYASYRLQDVGIGRIEFSNSIVAFFILFANLGIGTYGLREAAKIRMEKDKLSRFCTEMLLINLLSAAISYALFVAMIFHTDSLFPYQGLLLIYSLQILVAPFNFEWLCSALEDYKYITIRGIIIQIIHLAISVLAVDRYGDEWKYVMISVLATVLTNFCNTYHVHRRIKLIFHGLQLRKHTKPILILFARTLSVSIYANLDSIMLGIMAGDSAVGRYSVAVRLNKAVIPLITSLGAVFIPRLSFLAECADREAHGKIMDKAFQICMILSFPIACGMMLLSSEIIQMVSGEAFQEASMTMKIISPVIVLIPFTTVVNDQILVPLREDTKVLLSTIMGAFTNVIANAILIPFLKENGAAIGTLVAETAVLAVCSYNAKAFIKWSTIIKNILTFSISSLLMACGVKLIKTIPSLNDIKIIFFSVAGGASIYTICLILLKNDLILDIIRQLKKGVSQ